MIVSPFFLRVQNTANFQKMTLDERIFDSSDRENILFVSNTMRVERQLENIY